MVLHPVIRFLLSACTDLAMVPALSQVAKHRRHFELFIDSTGLANPASCCVTPHMKGWLH